MKITRVERLIDSGRFSRTSAWKSVWRQIEQSIQSVEWPPGSGAFTLFDESGKRRGEGNGVKPIKVACMKRLKTLGWDLEKEVNIATLKKPGAMDAVCPVGGRLFCVEWETGNVSSSHRAINKMALGLLHGILIGGALIVPTRKMYYYLTDRIGNFEELEPYFDLWRATPVANGLLLVIAIEHDAVSLDVPPIPKGTSGRALQ